MKHTYTENGALCYTGTGNTCLDLFANIGSIRYPSQIVPLFQRALNEDKHTTLKILFWLRAARLGVGKRNLFHTLLQSEFEASDKLISDNVKAIVDYGYWKDLLPYLYISNVLKFYAKAIKQGNALACKWAPRKGEQAKLLTQILGMTNKEYRKQLKQYSFTVEFAMASRQWGSIKYASVPGRAMRNYSNAFKRHDENGYLKWLIDDGQKPCVSASYPLDIIKMLFNEHGNLDNPGRILLAEKQWNNLPDYIQTSENILPMVDVSGSMYGLPLLVATSLGLYVSERNKRRFKNTMLTFSESPELVTIDENLSLGERFKSIFRANWGMNTNLEKAYDLVLTVAKKFNVAREDMPTMLLILSDMEFDAARGNNELHLSRIIKRYQETGYTVPKLVFWNLNERLTSIPALESDDIALVSGYSPKVMESVLKLEDMDPLCVMHDAIHNIEVNSTHAQGAGLDNSAIFKSFLQKSMKYTTPTLYQEKDNLMFSEGYWDDYFQHHKSWKL